MVFSPKCVKFCKFKHSLHSDWLWTWRQRKECSQTLRGRRKRKFHYGYQFGLLDVKVLIDSDFKWSFEMASFWDSGMGKNSGLRADKPKCRFRATKVYEKKVRCWSTQGFFFANMKKRKRKGQPKSGQVVFSTIVKFHNFFYLFKYDVEAIWLLMQQTSGAIWADKIDLAQSAQFSYYFAH